VGRLPLPSLCGVCWGCLRRTVGTNMQTWSIGSQASAISDTQHRWCTSHGTVHPVHPVVVVVVVCVGEGGRPARYLRFGDSRGDFALLPPPRTAFNSPAVILQHPHHTTATVTTPPAVPAQATTPLPVPHNFRAHESALEARADTHTHLANHLTFSTCAARHMLVCATASARFSVGTREPHV
jgi:hypothetical protein